MTEIDNIERDIRFMHQRIQARFLILYICWPRATIYCFNRHSAFFLFFFYFSHTWDNFLTGNVPKLVTSSMKKPAYAVIFFIFVVYFRENEIDEEIRTESSVFFI